MMHFCKSSLIATRIPLVMAIVLGAAFWTVQPVMAQQSQTIYLSPAIYDMEIKPGTKTQYDIRVTNSTDLERSFSLSIRAVTANAGEYLPVTTDEILSDLQDWVSLGTDSITLPSGQSGSITTTIRIPVTASPGSYQVAILTSDQMDIGTQTPGSIARGEIVSLLFVDVAGDTLVAAEVLDFKSVQPVYEILPFQLEATIYNKGNLTVIPKGAVRIELMYGWDPRGSTAYLVNFNDENGRVLQESTRRFEIDWRDEQFRLGVYKATLVFAYGPNNQVISAQTLLIVIPWKLATAIAIVVLAFILLVREYFRRRTHSEST